MRSFRRASTLIGVAVLGAGLLTVTTASGAAATAACASTYHWTGTSSSDWATPANWTVNGAAATEAPDPTAAVEIPAGSSVELATGAPTVCALHVGARASLDVNEDDDSTSLTIDGGATIDGGTSAAPTALTGSIEADSGVTSSGYLTSDELFVDETLTLGGGSRLRLPSAGSVFANQIVINAGVSVTSNGSSFDDVGGLDAMSGITLNGNATVSHAGVALLAGSIATRGHSLSLGTDGFALLSPSAAITSKPAGGSVRAGSGAGIALMGTASIGSGASLSLAPGGILSSVYVLLGGLLGQQNVGLSGSGTFAWAGGSVGGNLTLNAPLKVTLAGSGVRKVVDTGFGTSVLLNKTSHFTVAGGSLVAHGANARIENHGRITQTGGSVGGTSASAVTNDSGAVWNIVESAKRKVSIAGAFVNKGTLVVPAGVRFAVKTSFKQTGTGDLRLAIRGTSSSKHATVTARKLSLAGKLQLQSAASYKPKAGVNINAIVKGSSRHGKFKKVSSTTHRKNTAWAVAYTTKAVNAQVATE